MGKKTSERRNLSERAAVVRRIINDVINNPSVTLSVETLQAWLGVPVDAARRILARLASSGVVREIQTGVFVRGVMPGEQPMWR
jgi:DNA-binding GntR family transcriptional regulator